jgi:hypothetical protein
MKALHETETGLCRLGLVDTKIEPINPNKETIEAMEAARRGEFFTAETPDRLLGKLDSDDA